MNSDDNSSVQWVEESDQILELAVDYVVCHRYLTRLTKEKKRDVRKMERVVRKMASTLIVDKGEVLLKRRGC